MPTLTDDEVAKINDVVRKAKVLSMRWTTSGMKVDLNDGEFWQGIEDLHRSVCAFYGVDFKVGFTMTAGTGEATADGE